MTRPWQMAPSPAAIHCFYSADRLVRGSEPSTLWHLFPALSQTAVAAEPRRGRALTRRAGTRYPLIRRRRSSAPTEDIFDVVHPALPRRRLHRMERSLIFDLILGPIRPDGQRVYGLAPRLLPPSETYVARETSLASLAKT